MKCKSCGQELVEDVSFCGKCGKPTLSGENMVTCKYCDVEISRNLEYCTNCGKPNISKDLDNKKRNRRDRDNDDDDEEGGIFESIGNLVGKLFG